MVLFLKDFDPCCGGKAGEMLAAHIRQPLTWPCCAGSGFPDWINFHHCKYHRPKNRQKNANAINEVKFQVCVRWLIEWFRPTLMSLPVFMFSDIDECAEGLIECHNHSRCVNLPGWYHCECRSGFHDNGSYLLDGSSCIGELTLNWKHPHNCLKFRLFGVFMPATFLL